MVNGIGIKGLLRIRIEPEWRIPEQDESALLALFEERLKERYSSSAYGGPNLSFDKAVSILNDFTRFWPSNPYYTEYYEVFQNLEDLEEIPSTLLIEALSDDASFELALWQGPAEDEEGRSTEPLFSSLEEIIQLEILPELETALMEGRGLGIDFSSIDVLEAQPVEVKAEIEVSSHANPVDVLLAVYEQIDRYLSPQAPFYTLPQMLAKGYALEDIVQGPRLQSGYLDPKELEHFEKRTYVHTSEIVELLVKIPGVHMVQSISLRTTEGDEDIEDDWAIQVASITSPSC